MKSAVQNAERGVVIAGNGDQLVIGADSHSKPNEKPMLRHCRGHDVAGRPANAAHMP